MWEYTALDYMTKITSNPQLNTTSNFYLLHYAIIKTASTIIKVRIVFDDSAIVISLNDVQQVGPIVQNDLLSISIHFRIVLNADIEKIFR